MSFCQDDTPVLLSPLSLTLLENNPPDTPAGNLRVLDTDYDTLKRPEMEIVCTDEIGAATRQVYANDANSEFHWCREVCSLVKCPSEPNAVRALENHNNAQALSLANGEAVVDCTSFSIYRSTLTLVASQPMDYEAAPVRILPIKTYTSSESYAIAFVRIQVVDVNGTRPHQQRDCCQHSATSQIIHGYLTRALQSQ